MVIARIARCLRNQHHSALAEEPTAYEAIRRMLHGAAANYTDSAHPPGCLVISAAVNCSEGVRAELRIG